MLSPRLIAILAILLLPLTGCVTRKAYVAQPNHPIRMVALGPIQEPQHMFFQGFTEVMTASCANAVSPGAAGMVLAEMTRQSPISGMSISQIVRTSFESELKRSSLFQLANAPGQQADAQFRLEITSYGFIQAGPFRRSVKPLLGIKGELIRNDGTVVWRDIKCITHMEKGTPCNLPEKVKYSPGVAGEALGTAAQIVCRTLIGRMEQKP